MMSRHFFWRENGLTDSYPFQNVVRDLNLDSKRFPPRSVHAAISAAKNDGLSAAAYRERAQVIFERTLHTTSAAAKNDADLYLLDLPPGNQPSKFLTAPNMPLPAHSDRPASPRSGPPRS